MRAAELRILSVSPALVATAMHNILSDTRASLRNTCQAPASSGRAYSRRIPLAGLKCGSGRRREKMEQLLLRLWESGNPAFLRDSQA
jgi:hypothetical protein